MIIEIWDYILPKKGTQIRVKRSNFFHHGIYISDEEVIHFGSGNEINETYVNSYVQKTSLAEFLNGGLLEVRIYSKTEKKKLKPIKKIIECARNNVGSDGYKLLENNCEHFSNMCAFGESYSIQANNIKDKYKKE